MEQALSSSVTYHAAVSAFDSVFDSTLYWAFYSAVRFRQKTFQGLVSTMLRYQTACDSRVPPGVPWGVTFEAPNLMDV